MLHIPRPGTWNSPQIRYPTDSQLQKTIRWIRGDYGRTHLSSSSYSSSCSQDWCTLAALFLDTSTAPPLFQIVVSLQLRPHHFSLPHWFRLNCMYHCFVDWTWTKQTECHTGRSKGSAGTQTCIHQNIVQHSKFEKTDLPTTELGTTS